MIDPFGAFEAVQHGWRMFMHAKRATGRTTAMVQSLREGDLVVVTGSAHGNHLKRACKDAGFEIETYIAPSNHRCHQLLDHLAQKPNKRVMFDHTWVECFIADRLLDMQDEFDHLVTRLAERDLETVVAAPYGIRLEVARPKI
jgi:hypothetical protein